MERVAYRSPKRNAPEVVHVFRSLAALCNALTAALKQKKRCKSLEERILEIKLTLVTKRNPLKIKGFDSTVGAIIDADDNLVCVVPLTRMDWVFDCLSAKTHTDKLFTILSKMTDDEVRLCTGCKRNAAEPRDQESKSDKKVLRFPPVRRKTPPLVS